MLGKEAMVTGWSRLGYKHRWTAHGHRVRVAVVSAKGWAAKVARRGSVKKLVIRKLSVSENGRTRRRVEI